MTWLDVENLTKVFDGVKALDSLSFAVERGTIISLIGPNGAGKTTAINLLSGVIKPTAGRILLAGVDISRRSPAQISRLGLARTWQLSRLFPRLTVLENVLVATRFEKGEGILAALLRTHTLKREEARNREKAEKILNLMGLHAKAEASPASLSYGQQRLLEIARALASDPSILLLDEPVAGLHVSLMPQIAELLRRLREDGKAILLVEHHLDFVMEMSDRVIVLSQGKQIANGTPKEIQENVAVVEAYLGRRHDEERKIALTPIGKDFSDC